MFIYESHLGGLYVTKNELTDLYCDECGDSDIPIGEAATRKQAMAVLKKNGDTEYYTKSYIKKFLEDNWEE